MLRRSDGNGSRWRRGGTAAALVGLLLLGGCSGKSSKSLEAARGAQGDELLYRLGTDALERKKWEEARGHFRQLLDTYPRSQYAGDARLGIADSYFHQRGSGNLVLAIAEYRDFLTFFPNHPRADYAQYQIAYAHYRQMHGPDRDQEPTRQAVEEFERLIELYRNSQYAEEGRKLLQECYDRLAEHEFEVGRFYLNTRKHCRAAIARLKYVADTYPTYSRIDEVYFHLGEAHQLCNRPNEAMPYYQRVVDGYPESELKQKALARLEALEASVAAGKTGSLR